MAFVIADRVRETSTTTGAGNFTLAGAVTGYQTFDTVLDTGDTTYYTIADQSGANWEVGIGTFTSPSTLARTTILSSSNGGSIVTFTAGTKDVFISLPASKTNTNDQPNVIAVNSTSNALRITQTGTGNALVVEDSANPDATPFVVDATGNVGIGTSSPGLLLDVNGIARVKSTLYFDTNVTEAITGNAATNSLGFSTNGAERMRIDSSGNVGIGTSSPNQKLQVVGSNGTGFAGATLQNSNAGVGIAGIQFSSDATYSKAAIGQLRQHPNGVGPLVFYVDTVTDAADWSTGDEKMRLDASGNLLFNSGYGSVATAYGVRAWVNFNGTGTVAIRGSGNVSSITDNDTGDYTVNFTTAMPDANYAVVGMVSAGSDGALDTFRGVSLWGPTSITTTTARIRTMNGINTAAYDPTSAMISVFR